MKKNNYSVHAAMFAGFFMIHTSLITNPSYASDSGEDSRPKAVRSFNDTETPGSSEKPMTSKKTEETIEEKNLSSFYGFLILVGVPLSIMMQSSD